MHTGFAKKAMYSHPILQLLRGITLCVVKLMHQNLLSHMFKDVKTFFKTIACSQFLYKLKIGCKYKTPFHKSGNNYSINSIIGH